jgi:lathosterol oxidase
MMLELFTQLTIETLKIYGVLVTLYVATGLLLERLNRRKPRIQSRPCAPHIVRRDVVQSLRSLLSVSVLFAGGTVLQRYGFGFVASSPSLHSAVLSGIASLLLFDAWFYWLHRLLHTKPLFKRIHSWHHISRTPTPWSNNSDTLLDNCCLQGYWLVAHFILPVSPWILFAHKLFDQVSGMIGHAGHEYTSGKTEVYPFPMIAVVFHDQHHEFFRYNYGTHFSLWDRWMGTLHPAYEHRVRELTRSIPSPTAGAREVDAAQTTSETSLP